ncbi:MAG: DHH family phosphoesterase [Candidatus Saccharimonadales bacterium]
MYDNAKNLIDAAKRIVVIQPENPDADSLGTAIALEEILGDTGKSVSLFCMIDMPKYLHYIDGWARVQNEWENAYDLAIIVDTSAAALLEKTIQTPHIRNFLETHPVIVIDHHLSGEEGDNDLPFDHELILNDRAAATSEIVYDYAKQASLAVNSRAAAAMMASILGDTLGLSTPSVTTTTYMVMAGLTESGAHPSEIEQARREYMKKPADILSYKGELLQRVEYACDDRLALIHIPWNEIESYSDRYNPSVLVLDEMRLVEGVDIAIALKTYPDGKLTGKIRANLPICDQVAGYFGGGGHAYSAGFKIFESYDKALSELIHATQEVLKSHDKAT